MKNKRLNTGLLLSLVVCSLGIAQAQQSDEVALTGSPTTATTPAPPKAIKMPGGAIVIPASSVPPAKQGTTRKTRAAQTALEIYVPNGWKPSQVIPPSPTYTPAPPFTGYAYETPASLACLYDLLTVTTGCNPNTVTAAPTGGTQSIAIVDAYDDPFAGPDLAYFSAQFGLNFNPDLLQVVYENGTVPPTDLTGGWEIEESLDIEYSHAMAPNATIYLVEAQSNYYSDLLTAVEIANNLVRCGKTEQDPNTYVVGTCPTSSTGKGEVSMSWGGAEFSGETSDDSTFSQTGVVYFASAGDGPGTFWPCTSPDVVCVGGTTVRRSPETGNFISEAAWNDTGGGDSAYETIPSYQSSVSSIVGSWRGVPDVSSDANPITGVWVWDSFGYALDIYEEPSNSAGWYVVGGTSAGSPLWAGIVNHAGGFSATSTAELTKLYSHLGTSSDFRDVQSAFCGPYQGYTSVVGYDFCTGIGSDQGYTGK